MKRTRILKTISLCIIPLIFGVMFADLAGMFLYNDMPFAITFILYTAYIVIHHSKSTTSFGMALFFMIWMVLSYIPTGAGKITERIAEWYYLFFVYGLVQYTKEAWSTKEI